MARVEEAQLAARPTTVVCCALRALA